MKNLTNPPRPKNPRDTFSDDAVEARLTSTASNHVQGIRACAAMSKGQKRKEWINLFATSKSGNGKKMDTVKTHNFVDARRHDDDLQEDSPSAPGGDDAEGGSPSAPGGDDVEEESPSPSAPGGDDVEEDSPSPSAPGGDDAEEDSPSPSAPGGDGAPGGDDAEEGSRSVTGDRDLQETSAGDHGRLVKLAIQPSDKNRGRDVHDMADGVRQISLGGGDPRLASGFSMLNVKQLREKCVNQGLSHNKLNKRELIQLLQDHNEGSVDV